MKHTVLTLAGQVRQLEKEVYRKNEAIEEMQQEMDRLKEVVDTFLLKNNSAYKTKKALEGVDDFLGNRFGRTRAS